MEMSFEVLIEVVAGFEEVAAREISLISGAKAAIVKDGFISFNASPEVICKVCYLSQSALSIHIQEVPIDFEFAARDYNISGNAGDLPGSLAYALLASSGYSGKEILFDPFTRSGAMAIEAALMGSGFPVNYYRKDLLASALSDANVLPGVDFLKIFSVIDKKKGKRTKRIIASSSSMQNVRNSEKNAKVAGVNKLIKFSRLDIKWLDAKLEEGSIRLVVSYPPQFSEGSNEFAASDNERLEKMFKEFFYQADFFLKRKGKIAFLLTPESLKAIRPFAAARKFGVSPGKGLNLGNIKLEYVVFQKP